jgi:hypothetical protein
MTKRHDHLFDGMAVLDFDQRLEFAQMMGIA